MDPSPASPALQLPLLPLLLGLSLAGAGLAWRAFRTRAATLSSALLQGCLPAALWLLAASLNPLHPTRLELTPFGIGLLLAFGCGLLAARGAARRAGCSEELSLYCYLWSCSGALVGARSLYVAATLASFSSVRELLALHTGGLSMNGALLGAGAVSWLCYRAQPLRWRAWLDGLAPAVGLALLLPSLALYLQDPTRRDCLWMALTGLALSAAAILLAAWQRFHGQACVLAALSYGIAQLSIGRMSSDAARSATSAVSTTATWLLLGLAVAAGGAWYKGFTFRRI